MHTLTHYQLYGCAYPSDGIKNMNEHTEGYSGHKGQVLFVSWGLEIFPPTFWVFWFPNFPNYCAPMRIPPTRQEQRLCISQGKIKRTSSYCSNNMGSYVRSLKVNQLMVKVLQVRPRSSVCTSRCHLWLGLGRSSSFPLLPLLQVSSQ